MAQPQILVPGATVDSTNWVLLAGASFHAAAAEGYPADDDTTLFRSANNPANQTIKFGSLKDAYSGTAAFDPGTDSGFTLAARIKNSALSSTVDHSVSIRTSAGAIAFSFTDSIINSTAWWWIVRHLSAAEAAAINWADLQLWHTVNKVSGGTVGTRCSGIYLACPGDDRSSLSPPPGIPSDYTSWRTADSLTHLADGAAIASLQDQKGGRHVHERTASRAFFNDSEPEIQGLPVRQHRTDQVTVMSKMGGVWSQQGQGHTYIAHYVSRRGALDGFGIFDWPEQAVWGTTVGYPILLDTHEPVREFGLNESGGAHIFGGTPVDGAETVIGAQYAAPPDNEVLYQDGVLVAGPTDLGSLSNAGLAIGWRGTNGIATAMNGDLHCDYEFDRVLTAQEHADISAALFAEGAGGGIAVQATPAALAVAAQIADPTPAPLVVAATPTAVMVAAQVVVPLAAGVVQAAAAPLVVQAQVVSPQVSGAAIVITTAAAPLIAAAQVVSPVRAATTTTLVPATTTVIAQAVVVQVAALAVNADPALVLLTAQAIQVVAGQPEDITVVIGALAAGWQAGRLERT